MKSLRLFVMFTALLSPLALRAGQPVIPLWPEGVPDAVPGIPPESYKDEEIQGAVDKDSLLEHVTEPSLTVYRPDPAIANGTSVIISPGGGYWLLAWRKEGTEVAEWLNKLGVTAFVLKYRHRESKHPAPLRDIARAVRIVRSRAAEFGVDPKRIGAMGFSAGGHLTASVGTFFDAPEARTGNALDSVSARPDFLVLVYAVTSFIPPIGHRGSADGLFGDKVSVEEITRWSLSEHVTAETPPTFLIASGEDGGVPSENSVQFYLALRKAKVPAELHCFQRGPHGHGLRKGFGPIDVWPELCASWLRREGWLEPGK